MEIPNVIKQPTSSDLAPGKLIFHSSYTLPEILQVVKNYKHTPLNIEFHGIDFNKSIANLWREYGNSVSWLEFFDCTFDDESVTDIISKCEKLVRLGWHYDKLAAKEGPFCSDDALHSLTKKGIVRNSLKCLELHLNNIEWISGATLPALLGLYANVDEFTFYLDKSDVNIHSKAESEPGNALTSYSILDKLISSKEIITRVKLKLPFAQIYRGFSCHTPKPLLEYLRSNDPKSDTSANGGFDNIINFCTQRKNLQSVDCELNIETDENSSEKEIFARFFLHNVLRDCPKVEHLQLNINPSYKNISLDKQLFDIILNSNLKSLDISCEELVVEDVSSILAGRYKKNSTLRSLILKNYNQEALRAFLISFSQLDHLELYGAESEVLQAIWKYQTHLTSLRLINVVPYNWGFTGQANPDDEDYKPEQNSGISIARLQDLQSLDIRAVEPDWNATDEIFDRFTFPKLRYLRLEIMDNSGVTTSMMNAIQQNLFNVEVLVLRYYNEVPYRTWSELCSKMKKLRYLRISGSDVVEAKLTDDEYRKLFNLCPTLRTLKHEYMDGGQETYYYNVVQKKLMRKTSSYVSEEKLKIGHSVDIVEI